MNPAIILFTIRESIRKGILIFYFVMSTIIIAVFAFGISHVPGDDSTITLFGAPLKFQGTVKMGSSMTEINPVEILLLQLEKSSASMIMFVGAIALAGLIPSMLEKGTIDLFISKPVSRTNLLISRSVGSILGVIGNLLYFALGIWAVFGLKANVWAGGFLLSAVMVCLAFLFYASIVILPALVFRNAMAAVLVALIFLFFSGAIETRELFLYKIWDNIVYHRILDCIYYATPQLSAMLDQASNLIGVMPWQRMTDPDAGKFTIMPYVYSFCSSMGLYAISFIYFRKQDF
ncbi:MAG: ABC transporter permease subunit [bacterium]